MGVMVGGFVALHWISPKELGAWQFALLFEQLLHITRLGVPNAVIRQVPYLLGQKREAEAVEVFQVGLTYMLGCAALMAAAIGIAFWAVPDQAMSREALAALALLAPLNIVVAQLEGVMRGSRALERLIGINFGTSFLAVALLILPAWGGFTGYLGRLITLAAWQVIALALLTPVRIHLRWKPSACRELIRIGFPLYVWNYLSSLATNLLPWYIGWFGGTMMLGLFGPANSLLAALTLVPAAFSVYIGPTQNFGLGAGESTDALVARLKRVFLVTAVGTAAVALVAGLLFQVAVDRWLPQFGTITGIVPLIAILGCIRCYTILQSAIGLFLDRRFIRTNLFFLLGTRIACIIGLAWIEIQSFDQILTAWLIVEVAYLVFLWHQLGAYAKDAHRGGRGAPASGIA